MATSLQRTIVLNTLKPKGTIEIKIQSLVRWQIDDLGSVVVYYTIVDVN